MYKARCVCVVLVFPAVRACGGLWRQRDHCDLLAASLGLGSMKDLSRGNKVGDDGAGHLTSFSDLPLQAQIPINTYQFGLT